MHLDVLRHGGGRRAREELAAFFLDGDGGTLMGSAFADTITGGDGNETILADGGNDTIDGGGGTDTYDMSAAGSAGT